MILACSAKEKLELEAPAVVHVDKTIRPQIVDAEKTPLWHELITNFYNLTNMPAVLNTSFNVRGEPIVNTPYDALRTFYSTGLHTLVLGDYIIRKK